MRAQTGRTHNSEVIYTEKSNTGSDQVLLYQASCNESISYAGRFAFFLCIICFTEQGIQMVSTEIWTWVSLVLAMNNQTKLSHTGAVLQ